MAILRIGKTNYVMPRADGWNALAHASGAAFIELQRLEFTIISYLAELVSDTSPPSAAFDVFASKTFGNLLRALDTYEWLKPLIAKMNHVKERRDFFVHRFLFNRYGGGEFTTETEYEELVRDAVILRDLFAEARTSFHDFMFDSAPLVMFAAKRDPLTGEIAIFESKFSIRKAGSNDPAS